MSDLSERIGRNHAYIQQYLMRGVPREELPEKVRGKLAEILNVDESMLRSGSSNRAQADPDPDRMSVSSATGRKGVPTDAIVEPHLHGGMGGGGLSLMVIDADEGGRTYAAEEVRDWWRLPEWFLRAHGNARPQYLVALPAQGDSMEPRIMDGDVVFFDLRHTVPSPPGIYALADGFGGVVIKRLEVVSRPGDEPVRVLLKSDNPKHSDQEWTLEEIHIIGRYIARATPF